MPHQVIRNLFEDTGTTLPRPSGSRKSPGAAPKAIVRLICRRQCAHAKIARHVSVPQATPATSNFVHVRRKSRLKAASRHARSNKTRQYATFSLLCDRMSRANQRARRMSHAAVTEPFATTRNRTNSKAAEGNNCTARSVYLLVLRSIDACWTLLLRSDRQAMSAIMPQDPWPALPALSALFFACRLQKRW